MVGNVIIITFWDVTQAIHHPFSFQYSFHHSSEYTFEICRFLIFDYDTASTRHIEMTLKWIFCCPNKCHLKRPFQFQFYELFSKAILHIFVYATLLNMSVISSSLAFYKCGKKNIYRFYLFIFTSCPNLSKLHVILSILIIRLTKEKICNIKPFEL